MWMEEREGQRINHRRTEQALAVSPTAIATACPFCLVMLRDGTTDLDRADVAVRDVAELLADATGAWRAARWGSLRRRPAARPSTEVDPVRTGHYRRAVMLGIGRPGTGV